MAQLTKASNAKVIGLAIAGAVGGFLFGFDSSVVNGAVDSIQSDFSLTATVTGLAVAIALIGCAVGAIVGGRIGDRFGRIPTMVVAAALFFASAIGAALAADVGLLIGWRLIGGLGIGIASVVAPAYIAEISPKALRGRLGSLQQLAITLGIFAALLSDNLLANAAGSADKDLGFGLEAWRWMFLVGVVPAAVYGILALFLPESPRYRVLKGQDDKARETFVRLWPTEDVDAAPILLVGSIGMAVSLAVMAISFGQAHHSGSTVSLPGAWGPIALVAANIFVISFGASWGPIIWVLLGEIFPNKIRARALGVAAAAQWIANFVVTITFPPLSAFSLTVTYGLYALFALLSFFFVLRVIPETKGVSLEDSEDNFENHRKDRANSRQQAGASR